MSQAAKAFEGAVYSEINEKRWAFFAPLIARLKEHAGFATVLDVGAGAGYFAAKLADMGFSVTAVDGREENAAAIRERDPRVRAAVVDVQAAGSLAPFADQEFLFCAGLLYHLDNPIAGIRAVAEHPAKLALIETQLLPGGGPLFRLVEEGAAVTQGLNYLALVPTRDALVRLLTLFGRAYVYETGDGPDFHQFRESTREHQLRRVFVASREPIALDGLTRRQVPPFGKGFHMKPRSLLRRIAARVLRR